MFCFSRSLTASRREDEDFICQFKKFCFSRFFDCWQERRCKFYLLTQEVLFQQVFNCWSKRRCRFYLLTEEVLFQQVSNHSFVKLLNILTWFWPGYYYVIIAPSPGYSQPTIIQYFFLQNFPFSLFLFGSLTPPHFLLLYIFRSVSSSISHKITHKQTNKRTLRTT